MSCRPLWSWITSSRNSGRPERNMDRNLSPSNLSFTISDRNVNWSGGAAPGAAVPGADLASWNPPAAVAVLGPAVAVGAAEGLGLRELGGGAAEPGRVGGVSCLYCVGPLLPRSASRIQSHTKLAILA